MLNLTEIDGEKRRWVPLGVWPNAEVEIRLRSLKDQEVFRKKMVRTGIVKETRDTIEIRDGKILDFARAFAENFVVGWRGVRQNPGDQEDAPYDVEMMARIFDAAPSTLKTVRDALEEEADFFSQSGDVSSS